MSSDRKEDPLLYSPLTLLEEGNSSLNLIPHGQSCPGLPGNPCINCLHVWYWICSHCQEFTSVRKRNKIQKHLEQKSQWSEKKIKRWKKKRSLTVESKSRNMFTLLWLAVSCSTRLQKRPFRMLYDNPLSHEIRISQRFCTALCQLFTHVTEKNNNSITLFSFRFKVEGKRYLMCMLTYATLQKVSAQNLHLY